MALGATIHRVTIALSDVDRSTYESLELRLARHPSESMRFLVTRTLAYALSYQDGIAFSKGGISDTDEPPIAVRDPTGIFLAWIDVGVPAAELLHKASKAARQVSVYTTSDLAALRARSDEIHRAERIEIVTLPGAFVDALEPMFERQTELEIVRSDGHLYVTHGGVSRDTALAIDTLGSPS